jgi:hypothetical protein
MQLFWEAFPVGEPRHLGIFSAAHLAPNISCRRETALAQLKGSRRRP